MHDYTMISFRFSGMCGTGRKSVA